MSASTSARVAGPDTPPSEREHREQRLDRIGWGLFLLMTGVLWLFPAGRLPSGTWLICTGLLLLALGAMRYLAGVRVSAVLTILGLLALAGGVADVTGSTLPLLAIGLIVFGALLVIRPSPSLR